MYYRVKLYSKFENEIENFLSSFYDKKINLDNTTLWQKEFQNPLELIDLATVFADNKAKIKATMLISLDKDVYISITENNINQIVKYIYERFPY